MRYRLYLDESGDHTSSHATDVGKRYLGLVGILIEQTEYATVAGAVEQFKRDHLEFDLDDGSPILHREDIFNRRGAFSVLADPVRKAAFDDGLIELIASANFKVIAVALDKHTHSKATYRRLRHPYHYCLIGMLERYCGLLAFQCNTGDVMAEARGGAEDTHLKDAYRDLWENGKMYLRGDVCQKTLTSKELKIKPKHANIAGLQLADLLAHPLTRDVLRAYGRLKTANTPFGTRICEAVRGKYNKQVYQGRINGYGRVILS